MIKMPIVITIMLTAIMVLAFNCFQMHFLIRKKQCFSLSEQNRMSKIQSCSCRIRKVNTSKCFRINIHRIHKLKSIKYHRCNFLKYFGLPISASNSNDCLFEGWFEPTFYRQSAPPPAFYPFVNL